MGCAVVGCSQVHRNANGYCHNHQAQAAAALAEATVSGGAVLTITKKLGKAGAEALAPYVRENSRLQSLVLRGTKLSADGMRVLAEALKQNAVLTALDVAENKLGAEGAKAVAELVRWGVPFLCVCMLVVLADGLTSLCLLLYSNGATNKHGNADACGNFNGDDKWRYGMEWRATACDDASGGGGIPSI